MLLASAVLFGSRSHAIKLGSGGRAPSTPVGALAQRRRGNLLPPPLPEEARLTIVQITDVYTLENFPRIKTLLETVRRDSNPNTISMLTGDFLAPYLLSSIDQGIGMMTMIDETPIDYLTWGNHEADIPHETVCRHVRNYRGTWINSNMQDHAEMEHQVPFSVIEVPSEDGSQLRRVGLVAVLSDDPALYKASSAPGAFGGATIDCPYETLRRYKDLLEGPDYNCDMVIPLQHMYVPDDHKTCRDFDFPVVLSGHDHHRVDEVVEGTRLLKPGLDGIYATVLDLTWPTAKAETTPSISATFVRAEDFVSDGDLSAKVRQAYEVLGPLRNTELARVPSSFRPFSSANSRGSLTTVGKFM